MWSQYALLFDSNGDRGRARACACGWRGEYICQDGWFCIGILAEDGFDLGDCAGREGGLGTQQKQVTRVEAAAALHRASF